MCWSRECGAGSEVRTAFAGSIASSTFAMTGKTRWDCTSLPEGGGKSRFRVGLTLQFFLSTPSPVQSRLHLVFKDARPIQPSNRKTLAEAQASDGKFTTKTKCQHRRNDGKHCRTSGSPRQPSPCGSPAGTRRTAGIRMPLTASQPAHTCGMATCELPVSSWKFF